MTGEMGPIHPTKAMERDGTVWPLHAAIVQALRRRGIQAEVRPFDQYQGPYIAVPHVGRLWVVDAPHAEAYVAIYHEGTGATSKPFFPWHRGAGRRAVQAALSLL